MSGRRGFTFVEMLVVMIILGLLASIAVLKYIDLRNHAVAASVSGDIGAVRIAAYNYAADHNAFPPDAGAGVVPPAMAPLLPGGFAFTRPNYELEWDNLGEGGPYHAGLAIRTDDTRLANALARTFGARAPFFRVGGTLVYVLSGPNGEL